MEKIAILGFGKEGKAIFHYFNRTGRLNNSQIFILTKDKDTDAAGLDSANQNVTARFGPNYLEELSSYNLVCRSPGIPISLPELQAAKKAGAKITSATKIFFQEVENLPTKKPITIGVTGTKGKGTVSTIISDILKASQKRVALVGNIGKPALDALPDIANLDYVILELSSFQLQDLTSSPNIAIILDITPDHLDAHKNLREYTKAKQNIATHQTTKDSIFFSADNRQAKGIAKHSAGHKIPFNLEKFELFSPAQIKVPGQHTFFNTAFASAVCQYLGIDEKTIRTTVSQFKGLAHRLEQVSNEKYPDLLFYNDSYATTPEATAAAVSSFDEPMILIAGGVSKVPKYKPLARALKKSSVERVILYGENRKKIAHSVSKKWKGEVEFAKDLQSALLLAVNHAKRLHVSHRQVGLTTNKIIIMFSPASSSFDMFTNASERGNTFKNLVKNL